MSERRAFHERATILMPKVRAYCTSSSVVPLAAHSWLLFSLIISLFCLEASSPQPAFRHWNALKYAWHSFFSFLNSPFDISFKIMMSVIINMGISS